MDNNTNKTQSRKRFITSGLFAAAFFTAFRYFMPEKKQIKETVKMLNQDGTLVEIDADKLYNSSRRVISDEQLKNWVKKNK